MVISKFDEGQVIWVSIDEGKGKISLTPTNATLNHHDGERFADRWQIVSMWSCCETGHENFRFCNEGIFFAKD